MERCVSGMKVLDGEAVVMPRWLLTLTAAISFTAATLEALTWALGIPADHGFMNRPLLITGAINTGVLMLVWRKQ